MTAPFPELPFLCGALRKPRQLLAEQVCEGHSCAAYEAEAQALR